MSKRRPKKFVIHRNGIALFRILSRKNNESENIIKLLGDESTNKTADIHFSLVNMPDGFEPHITHESSIESTDRHRFLTPFPMEEAINMILLIFSTPENPHTRVLSIGDKSQLKSAMSWLKDAIERATHAPIHRKVKVFRECAARDIMSQLLNSNYPSDGGIDVEAVEQLSELSPDDADSFEWKFEDEICNTSLELAFLDDPDRVLILVPNGPVIELHPDSVMQFVDMSERLPGVQEYIDELTAKGIIPKDS